MPPPLPVIHGIPQDLIQPPASALVASRGSPVRDLVQIAGDECLWQVGIGATTGHGSNLAMAHRHLQTEVVRKVVRYGYRPRAGVIGGRVCGQRELWCLRVDPFFGLFWLGCTDRS